MYSRNVHKFPLWLSRSRTQHSVHEDEGSIPDIAQWVKDLALPQAAAEVADAPQILCCCGLWCRLAAAALIQPLSQELPYAAGVALKRKKKMSQKKPRLKK